MTGLIRSSATLLGALLMQASDAVRPMRGPSMTARALLTGDDG
jgi:hypothetical protein